MTLKDAVEKYLSVTGEFGRPMPLSAFGLACEETEAMLAAWEEDYQLHRHLELIRADETAGISAKKEYVVGGVSYNGIVIRPSVRTVIG
jgi:hypothetical protein